MDYLHQLRQSRNKPQVAFQEFALSTRKFPEHLFCFFEGKDNAYYVPRIKQFTTEYHPVICGGREKVLHVNQLIANKTEYDKYKVGFFIDRDFNPKSPTFYPPIFETPCYSIENLYVSSNVFKEILINEFHISETSNPAFQICLDTYEKRQDEFHKAVTLFNAWYACQIDKRNKLGLETGVNLDDKLPKGFVEFSLNKIKSTYDLAKIEQTFPNAQKVNQSDLTNKLKVFSKCDYHNTFRGKYEMQFLLQFIHLLLRDAITTMTILKNKVSFAFGDGSSLNNEQAINLFEGYAETPESLRSYLASITS